jgi:hypothetical protein
VLTAAQVQTMAKIGFKVLLAQMLALQETLTIISVPGSATTEVDQVSTTPTAALDGGVLRIVWTLTTEGTGTSAAGVSHFTMMNSGGATGFKNANGAAVQTIGTPTGFDSTLPNLIMSVAITAGTGETIQVGAPVIPEILKGANP